MPPTATAQTRPDVRALDARLTGCAYGPGDAGYDEARTGFVLAVDLRPAAVVLPETAEDVVAAMAFAREHGLRVAPQATGHNAYPLGGLEDAVLIKTRRMRSVEIDAERRVARVGAGAWMIEVVEPAQEHGLAPLIGSSPDVGVVGYTLGGGVSWFARKHGLGANNVVAIEVVTPDGRHVRADHDHEPELFWALRGGGGNFGVVTAIELRLFPVEAAFAGVIFFPVERAAEVLKAWVAWTADAPEEVTSIGRILNLPPIEDVPEPFRGRSWVTVEAVFLGSEEEGERLLAPLRDLGPEIDMFGMLPPAAINRLHMAPEGAVPAFCSDHLLIERLDDEGVERLVQTVGAGSGTPLMLTELRHIGGAAARSGADHGAIDTLDGEFLAFGVGIPMGEGTGALIDAHRGRIRDALAGYSTGREYLNFRERATDAATFFGPETHARLKAIRAQVDPARTFLANHPIN